MMKRFVVSLCALLCAASPSYGQSVANASFEEPNLGLGSYAYGPAGMDGGLSFFNGAGVQSSSAEWGFGEVPEGSQSAFIQYNGSFTQSISGLTEGGIYSVSFFDAFRSNTSLYWAAPYSVSFDEQLLGTFQPTSNQFSFVTTGPFIASSNIGVLTFRGIGSDSNDRAVAIDSVAVTSVNVITSAVPEPTTWAMLFIGFGCIGAAVRRRRPIAIYSSPIPTTT